MKIDLQAMTQPEYILERHRHGWLVKPPPMKAGVPMNALSEVSGLFPPDALLWNGVASALQAVFAIATKEDGEAWQAAITEALEKSSLPPELKWLRGVDTGASSKTIFFHLCDSHALQAKAADGKGFDRMTDVPHDGDDFGRCHRLLKRFPEWRERLTELAAKLPETKWPKLVAKWDELTAIHESGGSVTNAIQNL